MSKGLRYYFLIAIASCLLLARPLMAAEGIRGHLVSVDWLEHKLKDADVLILDASPHPLRCTRRSTFPAP